MDILWAGRLDRQKRPDILFNIAKKCEEKQLSFKFHVYGAPLLDQFVKTDYFKTLTNTTVYGEFDGLVSLPENAYDIFLYTSQWDGLPNILLEAICLGLPVIASDVGGVSELIHDEKTGYLIDPYDDVNAYIRKLNIAFSQPSVRARLAENAYGFVQRRHSWHAFSEAVKGTPGYITAQEVKTSDKDEHGP